MIKKYLAGIDIGAGSLKTMIISDKGTVLASAGYEIKTHIPHEGWSEQNPEDWWDALCKTVPEAIKAANISSSDIVGIGFSAGAHTPVLVDRIGKVIRPAMLWSDTRSFNEAEELQRNFGDEILTIGGNKPAPTWTLAQLLWVMRNEPEVMEKTARLYVAKDWLRSKLTGSWETDRTEAVGTLLFDINTNSWSQRLCEIIGLDTEKLPPIVKPTTVVGGVTQKAARLTGFSVGTPVVCGSSDTSVEAFGTGASKVGRGTVKLATAAAISVVSEKPGVDPKLINYPFVVPGLWYTIGATNSCASAHRWLADCFYSHSDASGTSAFEEMDMMATDIPPGSRGLLFHPYLQGERSPYWDPLLRADFIGIRFHHDKRHFVRALYEGVALSLKDVLEQLKSCGNSMDEATIIGGGSKSALWRQIVTDVLNVPLLVPKVIDASFGAALIAGVGVGVFSDEIEAAEKSVVIVDRHEPSPDRVRLYADLYEIYREAALALQPINHSLAKFG